MVRSPRAITDYDAQFDPIRTARQETSGKQTGDPVRLAQAVLTLIDADVPPPQLLLGKRCPATGTSTSQENGERNRGMGKPDLVDGWLSRTQSGNTQA